MLQTPGVGGAPSLLNNGGLSGNLPLPVLTPVSAFVPTPDYNNPALIQQSRVGRRIYVGNLPVGANVSDKMLIDFFSSVAQLQGIKTVQPILSVFIGGDGSFAFLEMRSVLDTTACIILFQGVHVCSRKVKVGRPVDYKSATLPPSLHDFIVGYESIAFEPPLIPSHMSLNTANCPYNLLLCPDGTSRVEKLVVVPVNSAGAASAGGLSTPGTAAAALLADIPSSTVPYLFPTRILMVEKLVEPRELCDDEEFLDIIDDVREETCKHGSVIRVVIPRPSKPSGTASGELDPATGKVLLAGQEQDEGPWCDGRDALPVGSSSGDKALASALGKVFVEFETVVAAITARARLNGRFYNRRRIDVSFFSEDLFTRQLY